MKDLHISVRDKVATYSERDGKVVCGNTDYQIVFSFDEDWSEIGENAEKTAVFIFNDTAREVKFKGDICKMPVVRNSTVCTVGVYYRDLATTTPAYIPCNRSILCEKESMTPTVDLSSTTATEEDVMYGETFYKADGTPAVGILKIGDVLPEVTEEDEGKVMRVVLGKWSVAEFPWFDLTEMGMGVITEDGELLMTDTSYIRYVLDNGPTGFIFNVRRWDGEVEKVKAVMTKYEVDGIYYCKSFIRSQAGSTTNIASLMITTTDVYGVLTPISGGGASSWNDLADRPFGDNEDGTVKQLDNKYLAILDETPASETVIFPEQDVQFVAGEGNPTDVAVLVAGETYHVLWGTEEYVFEATDVTFNGLAGVAIGNTSIIGVGEDTGVGFILGYSSEYGINVFLTKEAEDSTHTVKIYQTTPETITLKEEYMPMEAIDKRIDVYIEKALGGDY